MAAAPTVSAVIPTIGRSTLGRAIRSALDQHVPPVDVLVVAGPGEVGDVAELADPRVRVVVTDQRGPSGRRMAGVRAGTGELVAFLDDDDEWLPHKLTHQLAAYADAARTCRYPVVSCRVQVVEPDGALQRVEPDVVYAGGPVTTYLFRRTAPRAIGVRLGSSSLLVSRELALAEPWDVGLDLHEDWEWVIRMCRRADTRLVMVEEPLLRYLNQPVAVSTSQPRGSWRRSVAFADLVGLAGAERGDFLLSLPAAAAVVHGDRATAATIAWRAARTGPPGRYAWLLFGLQFALPPSTLRTVSRVVRREGRRG